MGSGMFKILPTNFWFTSHMFHIYIYIYYKDKFCLYNLFKILSSFLISVLVSGWSWWINFQPETKTLIRKLEKVLNKFC